MTGRVQHKRSSIAGNVPTADKLEVGEIAINFADRYLYTKNGANAIVRLTSVTALQQPQDQGPGDYYVDTATGKMYAYFDSGTGNDWHEIAPPQDLSPYVPLSGGIMTGPITISGTATGNQGVGFNQATSMVSGSLTGFIKADGSVAMTGHLTLANSNPTDPLHAASKGYVDQTVIIATPDLTDYLALSGGVMLGHITLPGGGTGNQAASAGDLTSAMAAHVAKPNPHPQYASATDFATHKATGGDQHPLATATDAGFMSGDDKERFDLMDAATNAEVDTGTDPDKYISPLTLQHKFDTGVLGKAREKLIADRVYYVRTDGDDTHDGLGDVPERALRTWQKAVDIVAKLDFNNYIVVIKCSQTAVTFTAGATIPRLVGVSGPGNLILQGDTATPSNVTLSVTGEHVFRIDGGQCRIEGFKFAMVAGSPVTAVIWAENFARVEQRQNTFAAIDNTGAYAITAHLYATVHGHIRSIGPYTIEGAAKYHLYATELAVLSCLTHVVTITGTVAFTAFVFNAILSLVDYSQSATFTGTVTGQRYNGSSNSLFWQPTTSTTFFPGSTAGVLATGALIVQ